MSTIKLIISNILVGVVAFTWGMILEHHLTRDNSTGSSEPVNHNFTTNLDGVQVGLDCITLATNYNYEFPSKTKKYSGHGEISMDDCDITGTNYWKVFHIQIKDGTNVYHFSEDFVMLTPPPDTSGMIGKMFESNNVILVKTNADDKVLMRFRE